jgi:hypothetical protein
MLVPVPPSVAGADLAGLWARVLACLDTEDADALGVVRAGISDRVSKPWAMTNDGEEVVNLTLELKPDQLELDIVGWNEPQANLLKDWLQSRPGERAINALKGYEVVAFMRRAYKKTPTSKPWWQDEEIIELGSCNAESFSAIWISKQMFGLGNRRDEKPAFHVRRSWTRAAIAELGEDLPEVIAQDVRRVLPVLREIWLQSPP